MGNIDYFKILTILGAVFTFIIAYFDKEHKKNLDLKEEYFKNILVPYINKYRKNKKINPIKFLKSKDEENIYFIPPYIFYLLDERNKVDLHKVLIEDYKENFPSSKNSIWKTFNRLDKIIDLISVFLLGILFGLISLLIIVLIIEMFKSTNFNDVLKYILYIVLFIIGLVILTLLNRNSFKNDDYSSSKSIIIKRINKKKKDYDKSKDSNYFA
ncbi:hypothetical protein H8J79_04110 [Clostridium perfringens]|uniref:hypothetical protein n=1 Tax=Clostridium perfringens TaxID=1502 RepID=UPI0018E4769A|nr:hypothetical protein [Clostridium perfringens]MBI6020018.1 hypothetical protein [Clostridium perfringens]MDK0809499.1 hypothetical protein [Clostridium perfringens]MDM0630764.1 hypothetical protein [Clostridium perfringens]MDO6232034.1 hypothetical protein [Clostridium perfringens]WDT38166.1 hypothetical protein PVA22_08015 [Clostridium perfringens]